MRIFLLLVFCILSVTANIEAQVKVCCIGNSITFGYGLPDQDRVAKSYPGRLQTLFGTTKYTVENDGVNSTTLLKYGDNPYWKTVTFSQVFTFQPDIITIKLGTNDTKPYNWDVHWRDFKGDYLWMIDTLSSMASKPKIWLVLPVPVFDHPVGASWGIRDSVIKKIIPIIKEIGVERGLPVIDANTLLQSFPQYFSVDGVHPSEAGLDTIARVIYRRLSAVTGAEERAGGLKPLPHRERERNLHVNLLSFHEEWPGYGGIVDLAGRKTYLQRYNQEGKAAPVKLYIRKNAH